jgi:hypothetical protein
MKMRQNLKYNRSMCTPINHPIAKVLVAGLEGYLEG